MRNILITLGKNYLVCAIAASIVLQPVAGIAQSLPEEKEKKEFEKKVKEKTKILIEDLEWNHQQIRSYIFDELKEKKISLDQEHLDAEKKNSTLSKLWKKKGFINLHQWF